MANETIIPGVRITAITRLDSSANGNPRFQLHTDHGDFKTGVDAAIGYGIANLTNSRFDTYAIGDGAPPCDLVTTGKRGNVIAVRRDGRNLS